MIRSKTIVAPDRDAPWPRFSTCRPLTNFEYTNGCYASLDDYGLGKQQTDALAQSKTLDQMAALLVLKANGKQSGAALDVAVHAVAAARRNSVAIEPRQVTESSDALASLLQRLRSLSRGPKAEFDEFLIETIGPIALGIVQLDSVEKSEKAEMAVRVALAELDKAKAGTEIRFLQGERLMVRSAQELSGAAALAVQNLRPELEFRDYVKLTKIAD